jgi:hypothetical protein
MFTPGLAILYLATILRSDHVCGVQWSRVWRKSRFLEYSIGRRQHAGRIKAILRKANTQYNIRGEISILNAMVGAIYGPPRPPIYRGLRVIHAVYPRSNQARQNRSFCLRLQGINSNTYRTKLSARVGNSTYGGTNQSYYTVLSYR